MHFYLNVGQFVFIRNYFKVLQFFFCNFSEEIFVAQFWKRCLPQLKSKVEWNMSLPGMDKPKDGAAM